MKMNAAVYVLLRVANVKFGECGQEELCVFWV